MGIPTGAWTKSCMYILLEVYSDIYLLGYRLNTLSRLARSSLWSNKVNLRLIAIWGVGRDTHTMENVGCLRKMVLEKTGDRFRALGG